jgi:hypothetical protein
MLWNMDMKFRMWNVRSLYRAGSLMTVSRELSKYKSDLVGVQVRWAGEYTFFYGKGNVNHDTGKGYFVHKRIISAAKRVCLSVIGHYTKYWCHIIVLNICAPTEDKTDDVKDSFFEELKRVFDKILEIPCENSARRFQCLSR